MRLEEYTSWLQGVTKDTKNSPKVLPTFLMEMANGAGQYRPPSQPTWWAVNSPVQNREIVRWVAGLFFWAQSMKAHRQNRPAYDPAQPAKLLIFSIVFI